MEYFIKIILAVFAAYRAASMLSSEEGPYLPFLYKSKQQTGIFEYIRARLGAYEYGEDGLPATALGRGISCPLCTGVYLSAIMTLLIIFPTRVGNLIITWLGIAGFQTFLENLTSDDAIKEAIEEVAESMEDSNVSTNFGHIS